SFSRKRGNYMVLYRGQWRFWIENNGRRIVELESPPESETGSAQSKAITKAADMPDLLKHMFRTVLRQQGLSRIKIERWNGEDIAESDMAAELRALGAERDNRALVLWASDIN
ncbi:hypothetical protein K0U00_37315, partial [Paenibacillus sepulcri]|nr:hypothetical protein [Paenibacillus sepulcri]